MTTLNCTRFQICNKCGVLKPLTTQFFNRHKKMASGFLGKCKVCESLYRKAYYKRNRAKAVENSRSWYEENKEYVSRRDAQKRKDNPEYVLAQEKKSRNKNREAKRARDRAYQKANRDKLRVWAAQYREANRQRILEYQREWVAKNRDRTRLYAIKAQHKRRVWKEEQVGEPYSVDDIIQMYDDQQGLCAYCETPLSGAFEIDHMTPLSRGGLEGWDNLAVTCQPCNRSKNARTAEEFMATLLGSNSC